ncbi:MAG: GerAB/ArcD/ProY family transporter [Clostridia bacterium]|nr:GerAB/ArcD/ProY family transporter [Clostridia bacterium]
MNLREGSFGMQESASAAAIAVIVVGIFSINNADVYARGNSMWLSSIIALAICSVLFLCLIRAMEKNRCNSLFELCHAVLGKVIGSLAIYALVLLMLLAAILPLNGFLQTLTRFIFTEASDESIAIYFLVGSSVLSMLGMEILARTSRLIIWLIPLSFIAVFAISASEFEAYRLYPLAGSDARELLRQVALSLFRYLMPLLALLSVSRGTQGLRFSKKAGLIALASGGVLSVLCFLAEGLRYGYTDLSSMSSPIYRLISEARFSESSFRVDKAILFIWVMAGILSAAYFVYSASLLYCKKTGVGDIRPVALCMSGLALTFLLMLRLNVGIVECIMARLYSDAWMVMLVPVVLLCIIGGAKRRKSV